MRALRFRWIALALSAGVLGMAASTRGGALQLRTEPIEFTGTRALPPVHGPEVTGAGRPLRVKTAPLQMTGTGR
jgi:hypothetical protein